LAADTQRGVAGSALEFTRTMIALRKENAALRDGAFVALDAPEPLLVFERRAEDQRVLCLFNLGPEPQRRPLAEGNLLLAVGEAEILTGAAALGGYSALFVEI
jgi:alpha-glucosidase